MINIIGGAKGTGKTKQIIDRANSSVEEAKGNIVFLTDKKGYSHHINYAVRLVNMYEYDIASDIDLVGFIKGLLAGNHDIEHIYIDGVHRICNKEIAELNNLFSQLDIISEKFDTAFTLAISMAEEEMPDFLGKYAK